MSLLTNWGYTLSDITTLDSLLSVADFNARTGNKYISDTRILTALASASQVLRDYAGWHLYPSTACEFETTFYDCRVITKFSDVLIQLPARFVAAVSKLEIGGVEIENYVLDHNGILRAYGVNVAGLKPYSKIKVKYTAGIPDTLANALKDIVANRTVKELVTSNGVQSETAGGVSITYSASWMADASGPALSSPEEAAMSPYKLRGVF